MVKQVKLKGIVQLFPNGSLRFFSSLYDGTSFDVALDQHDYEINDEFKQDKLRVDGWLYVIQEAQQNDRCYLTLPKASIVHGRQITVKDTQLMPRAASIEDFRPKKSGGTPALPEIIVTPEAVAESVAEVVKAVVESNVFADIDVAKTKKIPKSRSQN